MRPLDLSATHTSSTSGLRHTFEVANVQIHELLLPLSRYYPEVAFVNSELCLDDSSVSSACTRCKRHYLWDLPEKQTEAHWKAAAEAEGMDVEAAYETDDCGVRWDAEDRMVRDGLATGIRQFSGSFGAHTWNGESLVKTVRKRFEAAHFPCSC
jgi:hypothetical protein